jgi:hypothetical protein
MSEDRPTPVTLARLLEPFSLEEFRAEYYERRPLLIKRGSPNYYDPLITFDEIDAHVGGGLLVAKMLRVVKDGVDLERKEFSYAPTSPHNNRVRGTADKDELFARFYDGYTLNLLDYDRHSAAMLRLRHEIERAVHGAVHVNLYVTPRNAQGFSPHWDTHDAIVLQFAGSKEWLIYDSPITLPTNRQPLRAGQWTPVAPSLTVTLDAGDLLYIPRGFVHAARARDDISGHATIGLYTYTYADLLRQIADNAHADPWMRRTLPVDFQSVAADGEFLRHVHGFFDHADLPAYLDRLHSDFAEERLPDATNRLSDYVKLPSLGAASRLRMRSIVCHELTSRDGQAVLTFNWKELTFPAAAGESIRFMLHAREFDVSALPGTAEENVALCSTLVREGFLTIVS